MLAERNGKGGRQSRFCLAVEMAQKQSIWHYQPLKSCTFLRIVVATPNLVTQARSVPLTLHVITSAVPQGTTASICALSTQAEKLPDWRAAPCRSMRIAQQSPMICPAHLHREQPL